MALSDEDHGIQRLFSVPENLLSSNCIALISLPLSISMKVERSNPRKIIAVLRCRDTPP